MLSVLMFLAVTPQTVTLTVDGAQRTALVYPGLHASAKASPLVFVFHGHYGTAAQAARAYHLHDAWPEAIVVYPQGLPNLSPRVGYGNGWQREVGGESDRDLHFVDALIPAVSKQWNVDRNRVYACGMSNGALFTLLLLAERPNVFAAFASVGGGLGRFARDIKSPKPVMLINGTADRLVPIAGARLSRNFLMRVNKCREKGNPWDGTYVMYWSTLDKVPEVAYETSNGPDFVWDEHTGGHIWPADATDHIVQFFKVHWLP